MAFIEAGSEALLSQKEKDRLVTKHMGITIEEPIVAWYAKGVNDRIVRNGIHSSPALNIPIGSPQLCGECGKRSASGYMIKVKLAKTTAFRLCFDCKDSLRKLLRTVGKEEDYE